MNRLAATATEYANLENGSPFDGGPAMTMQPGDGTAPIRELSVEESALVAAGRPFGDCTDNVLDLGIVSIKVTTCQGEDGAAVTISTPLFGGHSVHF
jgi:hypothetical protein